MVIRRRQADCHSVKPIRRLRLEVVRLDFDFDHNHEPCRLSKQAQKGRLFPEIFNLFIRLGQEPFLASSLKDCSLGVLL